MVADFLIRMDMPKSCGFCPVCQASYTDGDYCALKDNRYTEYQKRPDNCPLVELPTHGDLIDRDAALSEDILQYVDTLQKAFGESYVDVLDVFRNAPVVIPAEGKDENKHGEEG